MIYPIWMKLARITFRLGVVHLAMAICNPPPFDTQVLPHHSDLAAYRFIGWRAESIDLWSRSHPP